MSIIAWTYEADHHCQNCAYDRFGEALDNPKTEDSEGNPLHPVFSWDELESPTHCGDCHEVIYEYDDPLADDESEAESDEAAPC